MSPLQKGGDWILYCGTLASLVGLFLFDINVATKIFTITSIIAIIISLTRWKSVVSQASLLLLPGIILFIGLSDLIWLEIFKPNNGEFAGTYRSYLYSGKMLLFGAFIILAFSLMKVRVYKIILLSLMALLVACAGYAYMQQIPRITLAFLLSTTTAYAVTLLGVTICGYLLSQQPKGYLLGFFISFIVTLYILVSTGTRAAIISFPVIVFLMLIAKFAKNIKSLIKVSATFFLIVLCLLFAMKNVVINRANDVMRDIESYQNNNSKTSIGARFAMVEAGILTAKYNFLGQSIEERALNIKSLNTHYKRLDGAVIFINVHLHNELVEALSLKGIFGVTMVIILYVTLFWSVIRQKNITLFGITLALLLFGLSDVLLYARDIPIVMTLCIALSILLNKKNYDDSKVIS
ncbi:TPA: O-antigen ligase family protein [Citrobacter freundii]